MEWLIIVLVVGGVAAWALSRPRVPVAPEVPEKTIEEIAKERLEEPPVPLVPPPVEVEEPIVVPTPPPPIVEEPPPIPIPTEYTCPECGETFGAFAELTYHLMQHPTVPIPPAPVVPIPIEGAVTIDWLEVKFSNNVMYVRTAITNHTSKTYTHDGLLTKIGYPVNTYVSVDGYGGAVGYLGHLLFNFTRLPPGTHIFSGEWRYGFGVAVGQSLDCSVHFWSADMYEDIIIADVCVAFRDTLNSSWKRFKVNPGGMCPIIGRPIGP